MPLPDQMLRSHHMFLRMQMQYRASAVDKMKIEPVKISFMENATTSKMVDQNDDFLGEYKTWTPGPGCSKAG